MRKTLEDEARWELIESSFGAISGDGHEWDDDAAAWVRAQRHAENGASADGGQARHENV